MAVMEELLGNRYLLRDLLRVYAGLLQEQKALHAVNCPACEVSEQPCRKYYWLFHDLQEIRWLIERLNKEVQEAYQG